MPALLNAKLKSLLGGSIAVATVLAAAATPARADLLYLDTWADGTTVGVGDGTEYLTGYFVWDATLGRVVSDMRDLRISQLQSEFILSTVPDAGDVCA